MWLPSNSKSGVRGIFRALREPPPDSILLLVPLRVQPLFRFLVSSPDFGRLSSFLGKNVLAKYLRSTLLQRHTPTSPAFRPIIILRKTARKSRRSAGKNPQAKPPVELVKERPGALFDFNVEVLCCWPRYSVRAPASWEALLGAPSCNPERAPRWT